MKNQISTPTLASREYVALPCVTPVLGADSRRTRIAGKHTGFAHSAGSLTWSPPT